MGPGCLASIAAQDDWRAHGERRRAGLRLDSIEESDRDMPSEAFGREKNGCCDWERIKNTGEALSILPKGEKGKGQLDFMSPLFMKAGSSLMLENPKPTYHIQ